MEKLNEVDMLFWGVLVGMTNKEDEKKCFELLKKHLNNCAQYSKCADAVVHYEAKKQIYFCGVEVKNKRCEEKSIHFFDLAKNIRNMISPDLKVDAEDVINHFRAKGYITMYDCGRAFLEM